jgi:hypothetical protein
LRQAFYTGLPIQEGKIWNGLVASLVSHWVVMEIFAKHYSAPREEQIYVFHSVRAGETHSDSGFWDTWHPRKFNVRSTDLRSVPTKRQ